MSLRLGRMKVKRRRKKGGIAVTWKRDRAVTVMDIWGRTRKAQR